MKIEIAEFMYLSKKDEPRKRYYQTLLEQYQEELERTHCPAKQKELEQVIRHCEFEIDMN